MMDDELGEALSFETRRGPAGFRQRVGPLAVSRPSASSGLSPSVGLVTTRKARLRRKHHKEDTNKIYLPFEPILILMLEPLPSSMHPFTQISALVVVHSAAAIILTAILWRYILPDRLVLVTFIGIGIALILPLLPLYRRFHPQTPSTER